jgi:predicted AAA+ superfamily ATPase
MLFPKAIRYDLLLSDEYRRLAAQPSLLREELLAAGITADRQRDPVIIDEVQKIPELLDEVHWLIESKGIRFILCGSSARKLKRGHGNLLGGRALRYELFPLVFPEIPGFSLAKALNSGLLPRHYTTPVPRRLIQSYVGDYLKEEISAEALARNIGSFSRFLEVAAISNSEIINYQNIARECAISAPTVKSYFEILEDTLIGRFLPAFRVKAKRRVILAPKFYFFDVGILGALARRGAIQPGSELFGRAFEHFIVMEVMAHGSYSGLLYPTAYWRTASQFEVDLILGDHEAAIEIKSTAQPGDNQLKGLRAFREDFTVRKAILVCTAPRPRTTADGIDILPWEVFLQRLWGGDIIR